MATFELDPIFLKGLTLLHSKSKDATEQLRQMVDDVIAASQEKGDKSTSETKTVEGKSQTLSSRPSASSLSKKDSSLGKPSEHKKEAEKRPAEKVRHDSSDLPREAKKAKMEETVTKPKTTESLFLREEDSNDDSNDKTEDSTDADDFAMEMGLACVLCRQLDVAPGNQLVECQECHNLYHQKCHKPPASEADVNDPRVVWYCARCSRNLKKMATKQKTKASGSKDSSKKADERKKAETTVMPFKRTETSIGTNKASAAPVPSSHQPLVGLASLAANLSGKSNSSKLSSSSSSNKSLASGSLKSSASVSSGKGALPQSLKTSSSAPVIAPSKPLLAPSISKPVVPPPTKGSSSSVARGSVSGATSTANAMKRLQMMKKKAAKR